MADKRIQAAPAALPNDFRVAVYYIDVEGYAYAEAAAMLNIPARHSHVAPSPRPETAARRPGSRRRRGNFAVIERRIA
jgi:hypothetical protein